MEYVWSHLKSTIYCAHDLFVPKFKASSHTSPKWFNSDIRHQLNRIHTLRNRIKKSATFYTLSKLSIMEENLQQLILSSKDKFVQNLCSTFKLKPKELYNHLNKLSKSNSTCKFITHNSKLVCDPAEKPLVFNQFFNSTFTRSDFSLPSVKHLPSPISQLSSIDINCSDVYQALIKLDPTKAMGCDNISPHLLKICAPSISSPVANVFCLCMDNFSLPCEWKIHKICPIPKNLM